MCEMKRITFLVYFGLLAVSTAPFSTSLQGEPRQVESLFSSGESFAIDSVDHPENSEAEWVDGRYRLRGPGGRAVTFHFHPPGEHWDLNTWNHLRVDLVNTGDHLVRVDARLNNAGALDWAHSFPGVAVVAAQSEGTLGFSFSRPGDGYEGPEIFRSQAARPNGHRTHWRSFDPTKVVTLRFTVHAAGPFEVWVNGLEGAWPYGSEANADLEELPYLDRFGQLRALDWPGKIDSIDELAAALTEEEEESAEAAIPGMNRFGGWEEGPQFESTGYFRTEKVDGKWWFVDPEGALFWSHGINSIGMHVVTPAVSDRLELFEWMPDPEDPIHEVLIQEPRGNRPRQANFLRANLVRAWGEDGVDRARDFTHNRLRSWGINTLGGWSDVEMMRQGRTPYTLTIGTWRTNLNDGGGHFLPDPFDPRFEETLRGALEAHSWAREDPWCLGVFIHNELEWPNDLAPILFNAGPDRHAKIEFVRQLGERYPDIATLNEAWGSSLQDWDALLEARDPPVEERTEAFADDLAAYYASFAERYFAICRDSMRELMPNHLYLGCRIHRAAPIVTETAIRYVDVFSSNRYAPLAAAHPVPPSADVPVIITEFHFGAPDRGVPGTGLYGVHDQEQRGSAYTAYVAAGLLDSRVIGTHWFAFPDQSAAGRPGENYQIGFIDITGRAYPEFTGAVRRLSQHLYSIRHEPPDSVETALERIMAED